MPITISVKETGRNKPDWDLNSDLNGQITAQQLFGLLQDTLINLARTALDEEQSRGFDKKPVVRVDNRIGKDIFSVNPLGKIEFIARQQGRDIILEIYDNILKRAPDRTGEYFNSNIVSYNGEVVAQNRNELLAWLNKKESFDERDRIRFINTAPYARKLERDGVTASRQKVKVGLGSRKKTAFRNTVRVPNGTYALAARAVRAKFKGNSGIKFSLIPGNYLGIGSNYPRANASGKDTSYNRREYKSTGRPYLYPTILLEISSLGILNARDAGDFG
jgi:hypothetical protein